jgi:hypothetical protein
MAICSKSSVVLGRPGGNLDFQRNIAWSRLCRRSGLLRELRQQLSHFVNGNPIINQGNRVNEYVTNG